MTLLYRGFNSQGRNISGSGSFASKEHMKEYLHKKGVVNYEIFESRTIFKQGMYSLAAPKELSVLCKQMSVLFYSHITLMEGVQILAEQADNKQLKLALDEIYIFMGKGYTFAESMAMYRHLFPSYLLNMIIIGEASGTLDTVFSKMSSYYDKEHKIRKNLRSAVIYPAILSALMAAIIILLIVKILPMFGEILESLGGQAPPYARFILSSANSIAAYGPIVIIIIAAVAIFIIMYIRTGKGRYKFDKLKVSIPAFRYVYSRVVTSRFSRSLSILLKSGSQLINALEDITALTENLYLEERLLAATDKIKNGVDTAGALSEAGIFPPLFLKLFAIGEKTGRLDEMLEKSAAVFDDEADDAIKRFSDMLEPALIIILSVIVGAILLSVMLPIISVINAIG